MGRRSLQASEQGIQAIKKALKRKKWSQTYLAGAVGCSRQTIWSLLQGNPTDCDVLMEVCNQLGLKQDEITEPELVEPEPDHSEQIDALVQAARESIRPYIQERCGMMRVLDMEQPIGLGDIYTSVNILERITGRRGLDISELTQHSDPEQFDRFCLGKVREKGVPGLEAVEKFSKLMILGKPGAGKTTFLKHLAIQCIGGEFQSDRVPIFITLKDFAEADDKPNLFTYIERLLLPDLGGDRPNASPLHNILRAGKALILLDGLDEVREADSNRVLRQIREFSEKFSQNQFVITCRIAAREYTFVQFTEVEVSDFDCKQITDFANKWFRNRNDLIKAKNFLQKLQEEPSIEELATSPLLLTLLCLVFEDSGHFPSNRAELYENGVDVLLKKWDAKRNIKREQIYKKLSLKRKEDLLSQIAFLTFELGNYFFKERDIQRYISEYIQNLPDIQSNARSLDLDSTAILKSIESQHGFFVERARGIYSFSHLTFHEYFTARKISISSNPFNPSDPTLRALVGYSLDRRWQEIVLLTINLLENSDTLLKLIKQKADQILVSEAKCQRFLFWMLEKSILVKAPYKKVSIRALYFNIGTTCEYGHVWLDLINALDPELRYDLGNSFHYEFRTKGRIELREVCLDETLVWALAHAIDTMPESNMSFLLEEVQGFLDMAIDCTIDCIDKDLIRITLEELYEKLYEFIEDESLNKKTFKAWTKKLRISMTTYQNIGHDWQFSYEQKQLLQQYYNANKLLVDCLNTDCYVSREVRQEIEDTLLLPIAEIEKRKQQ